MLNKFFSYIKSLFGKKQENSANSNNSSVKNSSESNFNSKKESFDKNNFQSAKKNEVVDDDANPLQGSDSEAIKNIFEGAKLGADYSISPTQALLKDESSSTELPDFSADDLNVNLDISEFLPPEDNKKNKSEADINGALGLDGAETSPTDSNNQSNSNEGGSVNSQNESDESKESDDDSQEESKKVDGEMEDDSSENTVTDEDEYNSVFDDSKADDFSLNKFDLGESDDQRIPSFHFKELFISDANFIRAVGLTKSMVSAAKQDDQFIESLEDVHERESETYKIVREDTKEALKGLVEIDKKLFGEVNK